MLCGSPLRATSHSVMSAEVRMVEQGGEYNEGSI